MLRSKQQSSAAMTLTKEGSRLLLNDHWGKNKKKEKEGKKRERDLARENLGLVLLTEEGLPGCSPASLAVCLCEWLWDWFILVHHLAHQSFTWDWVSKDDKSESLMWSKVSGSDSVWVNTKDLLFPFFFTPPHTHTSTHQHHHPPLLPCHPLPVSVSCSHSPSHALRSPRFQRYMKAMCGSGWLCELGARPHLRRCAEGADCMVTSFSSLSLSVPSLLALLLFLLRRCCEPLIDRFLSFSMHLKTKKNCAALPKVHSGVILNHVISWVTTVLQPAWVGRDVWRWPTDSSNQERNAEKMREKKGVRESKWKDEHGKSGVSTWPFEFKHMSDVVKTSQKHRGRGNAGTHWRGASLGKPDKSQWATWNYSQLP